MLEFTIRIIILVIIFVIGKFLFIKKIPLKPYIKNGLSLGLVMAVTFTAFETTIFGFHFQLTELIVRCVIVILLPTLSFGLFHGLFIDGTRKEGFITGFITGVVLVFLPPILMKTSDFLLDLIL